VIDLHISEDVGRRLDKFLGKSVTISTLIAAFFARAAKRSKPEITNLAIPFAVSGRTLDFDDTIGMYTTYILGLETTSLHYCFNAL